MEAPYDLRELSGVVIGAGVTVGRNSMIFWRATIGGDRPDAAPRLGDDVTVGVGACIIGAVTVGSRARIGPNSVVLDDIPADSTAIGVTARYLRDISRATRGGSRTPS